MQYDKKDAKKVLGRLAAKLRCRSVKGRNGVRGGSDVWQRELSKKLLRWGYEGVVAADY